MSRHRYPYRPGPITHWNWHINRGRIYHGMEGRECRRYMRMVSHRRVL